MRAELTISRALRYNMFNMCPLGTKHGNSCFYAIGRQSDIQCKLNDETETF